MKKEVLIKLKELYDLIKTEIKSSDECIIIGDHPTESNLIGTEDSYISLIKCISELILVNSRLISNDKFEFENENSV